MSGRDSNLIVSAGATLVAGCDTLTNSPALLSAEQAHRFLQQSIGARASLAREFRPEQRSRFVRPNGTHNPNTPEYNALAAGNFADWRLRVDGRENDLSAREFALAEVLLRHPGQVLSRAQLLDLAWGMDFDPGSNVVDVYVGYLRKKLGSARVETVRGMGYRFQP